MAYSHWSVVQTDVRLVAAAMEKSTKHQLSIWDALVIEAATRCGAQTLYSEDLTHGQRFDALTFGEPVFRGVGRLGVWAAEGSAQVKEEPAGRGTRSRALCRSGSWTSVYLRRRI